MDEALPGPGERRRRTSLSSRLVQALVAWTGGNRDGVVAGRVLLVATGTVITVTTPLVTRSLATWEAVAVISTVMTAALLVSFVVPWKRLPDQLTIVFPALAVCGIAAVGIYADGEGAAYLGLFFLAFTYIGLTQPQGTSLWFLLLAAPAYLVAVDDWSTTVAIRLAIGAVIWILVAELLAGLTADQVATHEYLQRQARSDMLTGLANRRDLDQHLESVHAGDMLVICDLDHFKQLNDTQGHAAGDRILADFGSVLHACLRGEDYAARYGGDEFVLILAETNTHQSQDVLDRLRRRWANHHPEITFSSGRAACDPNSTGLRALALADQQLYSAKAAGRDRDGVGRREVRA